MLHLRQVKEMNAKLGHHWFEPTAMRFFRTRILGRLEGGKYFVTSEKLHGYARLYSVRIANEDDSIDTVGEFQSYRTAAQARAAIRRLIKAGV